MNIERLYKNVKDYISSNAQDLDVSELTDEILIDVIEECVIERLLEIRKVRPKYTDRTIEF